MTELASDDITPTVASLVSRIARFIENPGALSRGDVSVLRRMDPRQPEAPFFKIEGLLLDAYLPGDADARTELETRWAAITIGLAHLGGLHRPGLRLGRALADVEWSELRFSRLLRANADRLADDLPSLARFLTAKRVQVDWTGAAQLILTAGTSGEEVVRRHLARDYYGTVAREERFESRQNEGVE